MQGSHELFRTQSPALGATIGVVAHVTVVLLAGFPFHLSRVAKTDVQ